MFATIPRRAARALLGGAIALLAGCGDAPSPDQCQKLLEHLIDLEINAGGGKATATTEDGKKQKKQIADTAAAKFTEACVDKTPKKIVDCSLAARTLEDVAKCDHAK